MHTLTLLAHIILPVTCTLTLLTYCLAGHAHCDLVHLLPCLSHMLWPCSSTASGHTHLDFARLLPRLSHTLWPCLPIALPVMHNSLCLFVVCLQPLKPMLLCLHILYTHNQKTNNNKKTTHPPKKHPLPPHTHTKNNLSAKLYLRSHQQFP